MSQEFSKTQIRDELRTKFDLGELRTLAHDLGVDLDNFEGGKIGRVLGLVDYCERHGKTNALIAAMRRANKTVFTELSAAAPAAAPPLPASTSAEVRSPGGGRYLPITADTARRLTGISTTMFVDRNVVYDMAQLMMELPHTIGMVQSAYQTAMSGLLVGFISIDADIMIEPSVIDYDQIAIDHRVLESYLSRRPRPGLLPYEALATLRRLAQQLDPLILRMTEVEAFAARYMPVVNLKDVLRSIMTYHSVIVDTALELARH